MVSRARGDHAAAERRGGQVRHLVVGAADLEGEHGLQVLALEPDLVAEPRRQLRGRNQRGLDGHVVDARGQDALQVVDGHHDMGCSFNKPIAPCIVRRDRRIDSRWA
jgi:hypothetical protein